MINSPIHADNEPNLLEQHCNELTPAVRTAVTLHLHAKSRNLSRSQMHSRFALESNPRSEVCLI